MSFCVSGPEVYECCVIGLMDDMAGALERQKYNHKLERILNIKRESFFHFLTRIECPLCTLNNTINSVDMSAFRVGEGAVHPPQTPAFPWICLKINQVTKRLSKLCYG